MCSVKSNIWDIASGEQDRTSQGKRRRKTISDILREAYRASTRDSLTRRAVKKVLR